MSSAPKVDVLAHPLSSLSNISSQEDSSFWRMPRELQDLTIQELDSFSLIEFARACKLGYVVAAPFFREHATATYDAQSSNNAHEFITHTDLGPDDDVRTRDLVRALTYRYEAPDSTHMSYPRSAALWIARGNPTDSTQVDEDAKILTPNLVALHIVANGPEEAGTCSCYHVCQPVGIVKSITDRITLKCVTATGSPGSFDSFWTVFPHLGHKTREGSHRCDTVIIEENATNLLKEYSYGDRQRWLRDFIDATQETGGTTRVVHILKPSTPEAKFRHTDEDIDPASRGTLLVRNIAECAAYAWSKGSDYILVGAENLDPVAHGMDPELTPDQVSEAFERSVLESFQYSLVIDRPEGGLSRMTLQDAAKIYSPEGPGGWGRVSGRRVNSASG